MLRSMFQTAATAVAVVGAASAAQATVYNVSSAGLYNYGTVDMAGTITGYGAVNGSYYAGIIKLQGTTDASQPFSLTTFCFDLVHNISVGFNSQAGVNYSFSSQPLTNDLSGNGGTGNTLSASQIERMSGLANFGAWMFNNNASDLSARMSAVQAAIWSVEYGLTASNFSIANAQGFYSNFMARTFAGATTRVLVASDAQGQIIGNVQGLGVGGVPEPESWALMIVGFGLVGVSARRRRPAATAVTA